MLLEEYALARCAPVSICSCKLCSCKVCNCKNVFPLADPRGVPGTWTPCGSKFFHFMQFSAKKLKIIALLGVGTPPWENPGSATGSSKVCSCKLCSCKVIFQKKFVLHLTIFENLDFIGLFDFFEFRACTPLVYQCTPVKSTHIEFYGSSFKNVLL